MDTILVVGDSFVDENWLASKFDTYHSYNVGHEHFISNLPDADVCVLSLCGAASVWRMLNGEPVPNLPNPPKPLHKKYDLLGVSAWNPLDHELLLCLLCPVGDKKRINPFLLSGLQRPNKTTSSSRCPYANQDCVSPPRFVNIFHNSPDAEKNTSTNRLIRVYAGFGGDQPTLEYRYDWRLNVEGKYKKKQVGLESKAEIINEIRNMLGSSQLKAIAVVDHGYGVMDKWLAETLHNEFSGAHWYVRCKLDAVDWLKFLCSKRATIRLAFTDEQLMRYKYGTRIWTRGANVIGRGALEILGDLLGLKKFKHTQSISDSEIMADNAALLLENDTAIGASKIRGNDQEDARIVNIHRPPGPLHPIRVGRSTVFFASLVYWDLMCGGLKEDSVERAFGWALRNAYNWTNECTKAWLKAKPSQLSGPFDQAVYSLSTDADISEQISPRPPSYDLAWKEWNRSSCGLGTLTFDKDGLLISDISPSTDEPHPTSDGEHVESNKSSKNDQHDDRDVITEIHLWRAQGTVGKYVCPGGQKRNQINELIKRLGVYKATRNPSHPFNCLFLAEPGWGKSSLAQSIAERFQFEFLSFNIAGMATNKDLMDALKTISSLQNEFSKQERKLLIFVDEIDAFIEGHSAMGLLLGPMWDGNFKTEGNVYRIRPCVWTFASTKPVSRLMHESKGRDFLARINGLIIELDFFCGDDRKKIDREEQDDETRLAVMHQIALDPKNDALRTEMVYQGVICLNRLFGPISTIDQGVLQIFYNSLPINGVRSLEIFVSRFRDVSGGKVFVTNVPSFDDCPELGRHIRPLAEWPKKNTDIKVKVIANLPK